MAAYTQVTTAVNGNTITAAVWNDEFTAVANSLNSITNAQIASGAGISYSKLALTGAILNADLAGSIAASKISGTAATIGGTETLTNKTLTTPVISKGTANALVHGLQSYSPSVSGTATLDLSTTNYHFINMPAGNITVALSSVSVSSSTTQPFFVRILQDGTGNRTVTWFTTIKWVGGSAPTLTSTASKADAFLFVPTSSGNYDGFIVGQNL